MKSVRQMLAASISAIALFTVGGGPVQATTLNWAGYTWNVSPYGIGSGIVSGNTANTWVDASGYLHLAISNIGGTWYGAEVATTNNLGFGSYYWVFSGPLTTMEAQDVLGGFTYGPQNGLGVSGQNEIDIEFSKWNNSSWFPSGDNGDFDVWAPPGVPVGTNVEYDWKYTGGSIATCRIDWSATKVTESIWSGVVSTSEPTSTANVTWTYNGTTSTIPQVACPFMFNLWAYGAAPTQAVDTQVRSFQFIPASATAPAAPANLTALAGNGQINLSWSAATGATSYNVYRSTTSGAEASPPIASGLTGTSYVNSSLTAGTTYYYKVVAVNSVGQSSFSNEAWSIPTSGNIAPSGTGYVWYGNSTATSNSNRVATGGVIDGNLAASNVLTAAGEAGAVKWEGAGVVWPSTHTVSQVAFINGNNDGYGNGFWQSGFALQYTTNGTTWVNSGWTFSPSYPYSSSAYGQRYTFTGTALTGVKGVRVVGASGGTSYSGSVIELQATGT